MPVRQNALGVARWLGVAGGRVDLPRDVVVISPHLDDAIFSLGAGISAAARAGRAPTVLTVLAGDPSSDEPAGEWDARAGFATAGEAARARRLEDRDACGLLGARPEWLPFCDEQYGRGGTDEEVRTAVAAAVGERPVLIPGFPRVHEDHAWLGRLLDGLFPPSRAGLYVEQPYAAAHTDRPGVSQESSARGAPGPSEWRAVRAGMRDRRRKHAACSAYTSQLPLLEVPVARVALKYELRFGGEAVSPLPR